MGGVIAAGVAMGWDTEEMDERIKAAFVEFSPLDDIAFPILAMTLGEKVHVRLQEHFSEVHIADLGLPFFCVSSNPTTAPIDVKRGRRGTPCAPPSPPGHPAASDPGQQCPGGRRCRRTTPPTS